MENKNKIIKARVNDYEESLVKAKAKIYGYKNLSKYLVDAAIYEKVTYVDIKSQDLIYNAYAENTKEIKKVIKELRHITKYATMLDISTIKNINELISNLMNNQKEMLKLIDEKLDLDVWQEINHNKDQEDN